MCVIYSNRSHLETKFRIVFHDPFRSRYTHKNDERMTFHCRGALDTIRLISVGLRKSVYHVLHVLFGLPLACLRCASVTFQITC